MNITPFDLYNAEIYISDDIRFTTDALLLAEFSAPRTSNRTLKICDLCSGSGVIPFYMAQKMPNSKFFAVDICEEATILMQKAVLKNSIFKDFNIILSDLRTLVDDYPKLRESFDLITVNPPYFKTNSGATRENGGSFRHEIFCGIKDVAETAFKLLRFGGEIKICFPSERLAELCTVLSNSKIEPKLIKFIGNRLVLLSAKKGGNAGVRLEF